MGGGASSSKVCQNEFDIDVNAYSTHIYKHIQSARILYYNETGPTGPPQIVKNTPSIAIPARSSALPSAKSEANRVG